MPKRIQVSPHLVVEELRESYLGATDPVERTRWQAIWLVALGRSSGEVAEVTGRGTQWVQRVVRRFNTAARDAVPDRRHENKGKAPLLSPEQSGALADALEGPAPDGGLWSGPKVALWMGELLGRPVRAQRGWDALRRAGFTVQRPRPRHEQADAAAQAGFPGGAAPDLRRRPGGGAAGGAVGDG